MVSDRGPPDAPTGVREDRGPRSHQLVKYNTGYGAIELDRHVESNIAAQAKSGRASR